VELKGAQGGEVSKVEKIEHSNRRLDPKTLLDLDRLIRTYVHTLYILFIALLAGGAAIVGTTTPSAINLLLG
jgi:hypothetical protein